MKKIRKVFSDIQEEELRMEGYDIVSYNVESDKVKYITPTNATITATFNVTQTGQTQIMSYRSPTQYFDLTQLEYVEVDGTKVSTISYNHTFDTIGMHTVVYKFKDDLETISLERMFDNAGGTMPYTYSVDLRNMSKAKVVSIKCLFQHNNNIHYVYGNEYLSFDSMEFISDAYNKLENLEEPLKFPKNCKTLATSMLRTFQYCNSKPINLDTFDTSDITNMTALFRSGTTTELDVTNWDVSHVTNLNEMFNHCNYLTSVGDLTNWETSACTNMKWLFSYCESLKSVGDLTNWHTSACTDMGYMFNFCEVLPSIGDLSNWDVSNVSSMTQMFCYNYVLTSVGDLSNWNTSKVTNMGDMFNRCHYLTTLGDLGNWNVSAVTSMTGLFYDCIKITDLGDLSNWDVSNVKDFSWMFRGCEKLTYCGDLSNWNVSKATSLSHLFHKCYALTDVGNLSGWNVSNVNDFGYMFSMTPLSYVGDLSHWDVSNAEGLGMMFHMASKITDIGDVSNWDVRKCYWFDNMFEQCQSLTSLNLSGWTTVGMTTCSWFVMNCKRLRYLNIYNWTTSACTSGHMNFLGGPYNDSLTTIVLGPNYFTHPTDNYDFLVDARHWSHDSLVESLITNQQTRDTSLIKRIKLYPSVYNTLSQSELDEMSALGLNVISS